MLATSGRCVADSAASGCGQAELVGSVASPLVIVIVLNWNGPEDTSVCVESLRNSDYPSLRTTVVDNGSEECKYTALRELLGDTEIIRAETNLGFGMGNNLGIKHAMEQGADYVLLVNNDTRIDTKMVTRLVEVAESDRSVGAVGPIIYYMDWPDRVWFAGYRIPGKLYMMRRGLHLKPPLKPVEYVDFVSGCGILLRRAALDDVGGFSPDYFMYYEDLDLCLRMKESGWRIACATEASMWHKVSASSGGPESPQKQYHQVRSSLVFLRRHTRGLVFAVNLGLRLAHVGYSLLVYLFRGILRRNLIQHYFIGIKEGIAEHVDM